MLIFNEANEVIILDTIYTPLVSKYCWIADLKEKDYSLMEIKLLEQMVGPGVTLNINGSTITVPAGWYLLIFSEETSDVDVIKTHETMRGDFTAFVYGPEATHPIAGHVSVVDYIDEATFITPRLSKNQMLCHPISKKSWVSISPYDQYNKALKNCIAGDFL